LSNKGLAFFDDQNFVCIIAKLADFFLRQRVCANMQMKRCAFALFFAHG
jgi:hypothetical protein